MMKRTRCWVAYFSLLSSKNNRSLNDTKRIADSRYYDEIVAIKYFLSIVLPTFLSYTSCVIASPVTTDSRYGLYGFESIAAVVVVGGDFIQTP